MEPPLYARTDPHTNAPLSCARRNSDRTLPAQRQGPRVQTTRMHELSERSLRQLPKMVLCPPSPTSRLPCRNIWQSVFGTWCPVPTRPPARLPTGLPACPTGLPACPTGLPACPACLLACSPACLPTGLPACPPARLSICRSTCAPSLHALYFPDPRCLNPFYRGLGLIPMPTLIERL